MKKVILTIILGIFLISMASASLGKFEQYECINIKTILNATSVNISTISYPNGTVAVSNQAMSKTASTFNYTFCNTSTTGTYIYDYFTDEGKVYVNDFEITPMGKLGVLIFLAVFAFIFIGLGIGLKMPPLGFIGAILLVLAGMYTMIYGLCDVSNLYTRGIAISLLGLGAIFIISSAYEWLTEGG